MRILLMPQSYAPRLGGLETVAEKLAIHLTGRGHQVCVLTNRFPRTLARHEIRDHIRVERILFLSPRLSQLRNKRVDLWLSGLVCAPLAQMRLRRLLREFQPDVVNIHFPDVMIPFLLRLRRKHRFRLVVSLHGNDVNRYANPPLGHDVGLADLCSLFRAADAVTACSSPLLAQAAQLERAVNGKGFAISNGIDPERFQDRTAYHHSRPYVLTMGRLTRVKGFDLLLEAWARAASQLKGVDLLLAGEGEERSALESQAQKLGLNESVHFVGRADGQEVVRLLNGCLFLAAPSRHEGFGIAALEALAAGKPVLATRVGGMGDFLTQIQDNCALDRGKIGAGLSAASLVELVEPTAEALADGLRARLAAGTGEVERLSPLIREEYAWARVAEHYERVLAGS